MTPSAPTRRTWWFQLSRMYSVPSGATARSETNCRRASTAGPPSPPRRLRRADPRCAQRAVRRRFGTPRRRRRSTRRLRARSPRRRGCRPWPQGHEPVGRRRRRARSGHPRRGSRSTPSGVTDGRGCSPRHGTSVGTDGHRIVGEERFRGRAPVTEPAASSYSPVPATGSMTPAGVTLRIWPTCSLTTNCRPEPARRRRRRRGARRRPARRRHRARSSPRPRHRRPS